MLMVVWWPIVKWLSVPDKPGCKYDCGMDMRYSCKQSGYVTDATCFPKLRKHEFLAYLVVHSGLTPDGVIRRPQ